MKFDFEEWTTSFRDDLRREVAAEVVEALKPILESASEPRKLVNGDRLAELTSLSRPTIDRLRSDGSIPSLLIGTSRRYEPNAVMDALKALQAANEREAADD